MHTGALARELDGPEVAEAVHRYWETMVVELGLSDFRQHLPSFLQASLRSESRTLRVLTACTTRAYEPLQSLLQRSLENRVEVQLVRERHAIHIQVSGDGPVLVAHEQLYRGSRSAIELFGFFTLVWHMAFTLRSPDCDELQDVRFTPHSITTSELLTAEETQEFVSLLQDLCLIQLHHDPDAVLRRLKKLTDRFLK
mmetsp:Transcript_44178/g.111321  ORF Transcript_44178/g.111321 Transcript_44178/m.111321 type:complete len:197 (-) Transcript_44178:16-606(-)